MPTHNGPGCITCLLKFSARKTRRRSPWKSQARSALPPRFLHNRLVLSLVATQPTVYPALEVLHIGGIGLLLGNLVLFELRVWGLGAQLPLQPLARLALGLALAGFSIAAASGLLMFASQPMDLLNNRAFVLKMGLLMLAGTNAAWFHARSSLLLMDRTAKIQTLLSIGIWLAVIICGRFIAYL